MTEIIYNLNNPMMCIAFDATSLGFNRDEHTFPVLPMRQNLYLHTCNVQ